MPAADVKETMIIIGGVAGQQQRRRGGREGACYYCQLQADFNALVFYFASFEDQHHRILRARFAVFSIS